MRIAAVSDLHGNLPEIPTCDLLIIAGDVCPDRLAGGPWARQAPAIQDEWLNGPFTDWLHRWRGRYKQVLATWGNHDFIGQASAGVRPVSKEPPIEWLVDEERDYMGVRLWFSPWTSQNDLRQRWAFMTEDSDLERRYDPIPHGIDVLVSHSPAYGYGDDPGVPELTNGGDVHLGSRSLRDAIEKVRPRYLICGHIHGGHGYYQIDHNDPAEPGQTITRSDVTYVYNVALVNEGYKPVHPVLILDI